MEEKWQPGRTSRPSLGRASNLVAGGDGDGESGKVAVDDGGSSVAVVGGIGDLAVGSAERHSISNFLFLLSFPLSFGEGSLTYL